MDQCDIFHNALCRMLDTVNVIIYIEEYHLYLNLLHCIIKDLRGIPKYKMYSNIAIRFFDFARPIITLHYEQGILKLSLDEQPELKM